MAYIYIPADSAPHTVTEYRMFSGIPSRIHQTIHAAFGGSPFHSSRMSVLLAGATDDFRASISVLIVSLFLFSCQEGHLSFSHEFCSALPQVFVQHE